MGGASRQLPSGYQRLRVGPRGYSPLSAEEAATLRRGVLMSVVPSAVWSRVGTSHRENVVLSPGSCREEGGQSLLPRSRGGNPPPSWK